MTRNEALDYLTNKFSAQIEDTGLIADDIPEGFGPIIDQALRELGIAKADRAAADVAESSEGKYQAFLDYFALEQFAALLAQNINIGVNSKNFSLQQAFANVKALLDLALTKAKAYGLGTGWNKPKLYSFQKLSLGNYAVGSDECGY